MTHLCIWRQAGQHLPPSAQSCRIVLIEHFEHGRQHASDFLRDFLGADSRSDGIRRCLVRKFRRKSRIGLGVEWDLILYPFLQEFDAARAHTKYKLGGASWFRQPYSRTSDHLAQADVPAVTSR